MHLCEAHETTISGLIDGELEGEQTLDAIEHMLDCAACEGFFRQARRLESQLAPLRQATSDPIRRPAPPRARRAYAWARWTAAAAALLLLGLALGVADLELASPPVTPGVAEVGDGGKMSDDRFVAVATELLQADRRDRIEMLQVLQHVQNWSTEESPGRTAALRTDVDLSPRWSQLPLTGETHPARDVY